MREFFNYFLESFRDATGWSRDNGYSTLNETANELLNFHSPRGLRMTLASLATPHFSTSYTLGTIGAVDGSISYLYSSVPLSNAVAQSASISLPTLLRSFRQLQPGLAPSSPYAASLTPPPLPLESIFPFASSVSAAAVATTETTPASSDPPSSSLLSNDYLVPAAERLAHLVHEARRLVDKPVLLCGRLYLPRSMLEAYICKRLATSLQLQLRAVSDAKLPNGGTVLGILQYDCGTYGLEGLASSDGGLLGVRGLYNFGDGNGSGSSSYGNNGNGSGSGSNSNGSGDRSSSHNPDDSAERLHGGRFSAGGEIYYGTLNKSGGISLGARFATLPSNSGTPLTATMTINPLMGNISASYAVVAREYCSLATKFDFNVYSYESEWAVGMELWSKRRLAGLVADDLDVESDSQRERGVAVASSSSTGTAAIYTGAATSTAAAPTTAIAPIKTAPFTKAPFKTAPSTAATGSSSGKEASPNQTPNPALPVFPERSFQAKLEWRLDDPAVESPGVAATVAKHDDKPLGRKSADDEYQGVLKARLDQNLKIGLLWEGRIQSLLFSLGSVVDLNKLDQPFRTLGLQIQFSS
ncbi:mitochondrial protein [Grosmannia clavigera kw1407]|uniref:Mitochondrial distribution and morphology protein 10 n=1 Tax=Grosmannia clavigera (strain kw1407 / UAMH 11150) TaxID=655863 RepID=F0XR26_GROCL|nr:mitochondrial protein [Grosmannia clavigera kw1407]EFW99830.1 mitochondrial protein [Grosmannia clavigera kw1407]